MRKVHRREKLLSAKIWLNNIVNNILTLAAGEKAFQSDGIPTEPAGRAESRHAPPVSRAACSNPTPPTAGAKRHRKGKFIKRKLSFAFIPPSPMTCHGSAQGHGGTEARRHRDGDLQSAQTQL